MSSCSSLPQCLVQRNLPLRTFVLAFRFDTRGDSVSGGIPSKRCGYFDCPGLGQEPLHPMGAASTTLHVCRRP